VIELAAGGLTLAEKRMAAKLLKKMGLHAELVGANGNGAGTKSP
jgi:hypothetical protein